MHLHVIAFDVPFPPDYGGVIDIFYKLKALKKLGYSVTLHCFEYGRERQQTLDEVCHSVHYYKRNRSIWLHFSNLPFIVASRKCENLLQNLCADSSPILFEGLHTTAYLSHPSLKNRIKLVRTHNIEHDYYAGLQKSERSFIKRIYYSREAQKLQIYQHVLAHATQILPISPSETTYFQQLYKHVTLLPPFHPYEEVKVKTGKGKFCLYHGNLAVAENNEAAVFLCNEVFGKINVPFIIAGNSPSEELITCVQKYKNITLKSAISTREIHELIEEAHINVLPTFQATGIKLKLLAALFSGRFCMVNNSMVENTGLEDFCIVCNQATEFSAAILNYMGIDFSAMEIDKRIRGLEPYSISFVAELLEKKILKK